MNQHSQIVQQNRFNEYKQEKKVLQIGILYCFMNGKKEKALISNNPTFDLGFISQEFEVEYRAKQFNQSLKRIKKCLTERKTIKSLGHFSQKVNYLSSKTERLQEEKYSSERLPQLSTINTRKVLQRSVAGVLRKLADKNQGKIITDKKIVRTEVKKQLNMALSERFALKIKKYGNWMDY